MSTQKKVPEFAQISERNPLRNNELTRIPVIETNLTGSATKPFFHSFGPKPIAYDNYNFQANPIQGQINNLPSHKRSNSKTILDQELYSLLFHGINIVDFHLPELTRI